MKFGVIGLGNMGKAIIGGVIKKGTALPGDIIGYDVAEAARKAAETSLNIKIAADAAEVIASSDVVLLAVKPQHMEEMLAGVKSSWNDKKIAISIAPGKSLAWLAERIGENIKIVRCMPNTPALIGEGCTGVCRNANINDDDMQTVLAILTSCGSAIPVAESQMDAVVGVSGSAPAYVFMFIEAMADAAVAEGMARADAYKFAAQAVKGSAALMLETGKHPGELKDMVCSPAGTTIEAVKVLEENNFRGAVIDAVVACTEKSKRL